MASSFFSCIWGKYRQRWEEMPLHPTFSAHPQLREDAGAAADKTLPEEGQESSMGKNEWTYDIAIHQDRQLPTERSESAFHLAEIVVFNNHWTCGHKTSISSLGRQNTPKMS